MATCESIHYVPFTNQFTHVCLHAQMPILDCKTSRLILHKSDSDGKNHHYWSQTPAFFWGKTILFLDPKFSVTNNHHFHRCLPRWLPRSSGGSVGVPQRALGDPWGPRLRPALPVGPPLGGDAAAPRRRSGDIDSPRPALGGLGCLDTPIAGWFIWFIWFIMEKPSIHEWYMGYHMLKMDTSIWGLYPPMVNYIWFIWYMRII